jgi:hypothetical protein
VLADRLHVGGDGGGGVLREIGALLQLGAALRERLERQKVDEVALRIALAARARVKIASGSSDRSTTSTWRSIVRPFGIERFSGTATASVAASRNETRGFQIR